MYKCLKEYLMHFDVFCKLGNFAQMLSYPYSKEQKDFLQKWTKGQSYGRKSFINQTRFH